MHSPRYSPNGSLIIGLLESVPCTATISGFYKNNSHEYAGGTEIHWDDQKPILDADGQLQYVDENGDTWALNQIGPTVPDLVWTPDTIRADHPTFGSGDWCEEVSSGKTRLGYVEWVNAHITRTQNKQETIDG